MAFIDSGKAEGATVTTGGDRHGNEGYFINPTIFTNTKPEMKIVKEEIFGPVGVVIKFKDQAGRFYRWVRYLSGFDHQSVFRRCEAGERHHLRSSCFSLQPRY